VVKRNRTSRLKGMAVLLIALSIGFAGFIAGGSPAGAEPEYAKWGRLAMQTADEKFDADIVDYKYLGRSEMRQGEAVETFRLWLKRPDREFGVLVRITVDTRTDQAKKVESETIAQ
jgi:hypothetical protein